MTRDGRIPLPDRDGLPPEGQAVWDRIVSGPRGQVVGPLRAVLHSPELAERWQAFGAYCRYDTVLPARLNELAIILTGRRYHAEVEWIVHARIAAEAGLAAEHIAAILDGRAPAFSDPAEAEIYDFTTALIQTGEVPLAAYTPVRSRWGDRGVVELTAVIGYYSAVAMMLNAHMVPAPEGTPEVFGPGRGLADLPPR